MQMDESIFCSEGFEFVWSSHKVVASFLFKVLSDFLREAFVSVESSSNSGSSLSNLVNVNKSCLYSFLSIFKLVDVTRELLAKSKWCGVLGVCSSDFDDITKLVSLRG